MNKDPFRREAKHLSVPVASAIEEKEVSSLPKCKAFSFSMFSRKFSSFPVKEEC